MPAVLQLRMGEWNVKAIKPEIVIEKLKSFDRALAKWRSPKLLKQRFVIGFLFWTGVRVSEFTSTLREFIDLEEKTYLVPTLKRKEKTLLPIPLDHVPEEEFVVWRTYFEVFRVGERDFIFPYDRTTVYRIVQRVFRQEVERAHPHMLRHSLGVWLAKNGLTLNQIQVVLRHSNPLTTGIYTQLTHDDLRGELRKLKKRVEDVLSE